MRRFLLLILIGFSSLLVSQAQNTMVDVIHDDDDLTVMAQFLDAADPALIDLLSSQGNYTFLVPNDDAFRKFGEFLDVDVDDLLQSQSLVTDIISYHIVVGRVYSPAIRTRYDGAVLPTLLPNSYVNFDMGATRDDFIINDVAEIVIPDVEASNAVIHIINDVVFTPQIEERILAGDFAPAPETTPEVDVTPAPEVTEEAVTFERDADSNFIDDVIASDESYSMLLEALLRADAEVLNTLGSSGSYTFLAPTNDAFERLLGTLDVDTLGQVDPDILTDILLYHMLPTAYTAEEIAAETDEGVLTLLGTERIFIRSNEDEIVLNRLISITESDIEADNGLIHRINNVLLPVPVLRELGS